MERPDHQFALEPVELDEMVSATRETERVLGLSAREVFDVESELYNNARRAIHAVADIEAGDTFDTDNVKTLRPSEREAGFHSKFYDKIVGETVAPLRRVRGPSGTTLF